MTTSLNLRMTMHGRMRWLFVAGPVVLLAMGCGSSVSKDDFKATLVKDAHMSEAVATCVTDELFRKLDDAQLQHVYTGEQAKLTTAERQAVYDAAVLCVAGGPKKPTATNAK